MITLNTRFFGLDLKSPIVVGSSGLASTVNKIKLIEENGAGAVVLKSIFEEEIMAEYQSILKNEATHANFENLDYFDYQLKEDSIKNYLKLIEDCKAAGIQIPLVASINCTSGNDWAFFARKLAEQGVSALELNLFVLPSDLNRTAEEVSNYYFATIKRVIASVDIPVSVKISPYFSDLARMIKALSETGISGITLFNRFYNVDIDINNKEMVPSMVLSHPFEYLQSLRWLGIMSGRVSCEMAASTGVHDSDTVVKMLMAGASAVQVVSGIYKNGFGFIKGLSDGLSTWMEKNGYTSIDQFRGAANQFNVQNPAMYERVQFMKNFGSFTANVAGEEL